MSQHTHTHTHPFHIQTFRMNTHSDRQTHTSQITLSTHIHTHTLFTCTLFTLPLFTCTHTHTTLRDNLYDNGFPMMLHCCCLLFMICKLQYKGLYYDSKKFASCFNKQITRLTKFLRCYHIKKGI